MNALTIHQPWAWAIAEGLKPIENRSWPPPQWAVSQPLAIHAGKTVDEEAVADLLERGLLLPERFTTGAVVAVARLVAWTDREPPSGSAAYQWWVGPIAWHLEELVRLPSPVLCRGYQKLWALPREVADEVFHQWSKGAER